MPLGTFFGSRRRGTLPSKEIAACLAFAPDPFVLLEGDRIIEHSASFPRLLGVPEEGQEGLSLASLISTPHHRALSEILNDESGASWRMLTLRRPDGTTRHLEWRALLGHTGKGRCWWAVRDVTQRHRLEHSLTQARDAEQAKIARDLHDSLGQKLTGLTFQLYALQARLQRQGHPEATHVAPLVSLADEVIREVRDLAHGLAPVDIAPEGLPFALQHLAKSTSQLFPLTCEFVAKFPEGASPPAKAANGLYRIAQEAIANAHRHGKATRIEVGLAWQDDQWVLEIADNGRGCPTLTTAAQSGLGLQIMRHRVEAMGASLDLASPGPLGGVAVKVVVAGPWVSSMVRHPLPEASTRAGRASGPGERARTIVVDAHPLSRAGLVQLLRQSQRFEIVAECDSAQGALSACASQQPDLLITDILLSDGSALDYVGQMRRVFPALSIAVLSLYPEDRYGKPAREAGADGYLCKQEPPARLLEELIRLSVRAAPP